MPLLVFLLTLAFVLSPLWVPDFGGFDADQFPIPQVSPPVQPAGYAFAIWGVIYMWLLVSAAFGLGQRRHATDWQPMRAPLAMSLAVGAVWLPVAVLSPVLATVLIWAMLVPALVALARCPSRDAGWARLPVGLYAGWLSAASCVAIGLLLGGYGLLPEPVAALLMIGIAAVLASVVQIRQDRTPTYGLAVVWACVAIMVQAPGPVAISAGVAAAVVAVLTVRAALRLAGLRTP